VVTWKRKWGSAKPVRKVRPLKGMSPPGFSGQCPFLRSHRHLPRGRFSHNRSWLRCGRGAGRSLFRCRALRAARRRKVAPSRPLPNHRRAGSGTRAGARRCITRRFGSKPRDFAFSAAFASKRSRPVSMRRKTGALALCIEIVMDCPLSLVRLEDAFPAIDMGAAFLATIC